MPAAGARQFSHKINHTSNEGRLTDQQCRDGAPAGHYSSRSTDHCCPHHAQRAIRTDQGRWDTAAQLGLTASRYCGVNWVLQTCPELVDTSTWTGEPGIDRPIGKAMTAVPALSATMVNERFAVG